MAKATNSNQGFVLISFVAILPFLLLLSLGSASLLSYINTSRKLHWMCESQALVVQTKQAKNLRSLLRLNPKAKALQRQRKSAERNWKLALKSKNPKLIAAAKAYRLYVISKQMMLKGKQQALLKKAKLIWTSYANATKKRFGFASTKVITPIGLPVLAKDISTGSPTYLPKPGFSKSQRHLVSTYHTLATDNPLIAKVIKSKHIRLPIVCGGTLSKRRSRWIPILNQAKPV